MTFLFILFINIYIIYYILLITSLLLLSSIRNRGSYLFRDDTIFNFLEGIISIGNEGLYVDVLEQKYLKNSYY